MEYLLVILFLSPLIAIVVGISLPEEALFFCLEKNKLEEMLY